MLKITIPAVDYWDEVRNRFVYTEPVELTLRHCLVSLSKWEAIFEKPFLSNEKKTIEETYAYIQIMSDEPVSVEVLQTMTEDNLDELNKYIESKQSATWFTEKQKGRPSREIITAEILYHWMFAMQVPLEAEHWHLNKLFTLLRVISEKNQPPKKMGRAEQLAQQRRLNAERLAAMNTSG